MLYLILLGSIIASLFEFQKLKQKQYWREIAFSSVLLTVGAIMIFLRILNIEPPSPLVGIRIIFQPVSQLLTKILS
ncbi:hypothetical protein D3C76_802450 [compost metagenome]